jgi:hypothetical protein
MKKILFMLCFISSTIANAQLWCTPGSVWYFDTSSPAFDTQNTKHTYLKDTVVNGVIFNKIKSESVHIDIGGTQFYNKNFYTSVQNNVVFFNSTDNAIAANDTLMYFGPIGSKWRSHKNGGTSCSHSFIEITAIGTSTIQGQVLNWRKVNFTNYFFYGLSNEQLVTRVDTIFERIGYKHFATQFLGFCSDILDTREGTFRCFNDNQINVKSTNLACNYITNLREQNIHPNQLTIYPNPAQQSINVDIEHIQKALVSIKDVLGKIVLQQFITKNNNSIDISTLSNGTYVVELKQQDVYTHQKLIIHKN